MNIVYNFVILGLILCFLFPFTTYSSSLMFCDSMDDEDGIRIWSTWDALKVNFVDG